jgi:hypothetical protein
MKNIRFNSIGFFVLILLYGCDPIYETSVTIRNDSSYNLVINVEYTNPEEEEKLDVTKGKSVSFSLIDFSYFRDPNNDITNIIIFDMDTGNIIKQLDNNNLFNKINQSRFKAEYLFVITDNLLY